MRRVLLVPLAAAAIAMVGCKGDTRTPSEGASFVWISGGGSGDAYELPAKPPALDGNREGRCIPGQPPLPTQIVGMGDEPIRAVKLLGGLRIGAMDTEPAFDPDARRVPLQVASMDGERERMVPPLHRRDLALTDPNPQITTGKPEDVNHAKTLYKYRDDETWWCDPTGERHRR